MRIIGLYISFTFFIHATSILVMNSNAKIDRYEMMEETFSKALDKDIEYVDISFMKGEEIREYLYDVYPDMVYAIGTKAYQYAKKYVPEKKIFFSSIVNYRRFDMGQNTFGVSSELHPGIQLTLLKALLSKTKSIGMIYSNYTLSVYESFKEEANKLGIEVRGQKTSKSKECNLTEFENLDAFMLLADPVLLSNEEKVKMLFKHFKKFNIPVIAYHPLYIEYGAVLVISTDIGTIGRQIASMVESEIAQQPYKAIQMPIGTEVIFNKGLAKRMHLHYDKAALTIVHKVIQ